MKSERYVSCEDYLKQRKERLLTQLDEIDGFAPALEARIDTVERICNGTLPFGGSEEYLESHERNSETSKHGIDRGMSEARVDEVKRYLDMNYEI